MRHRRSRPAGRGEVTCQRTVTSRSRAASASPSSSTKVVPETVSHPTRSWTAAAMPVSRSRPRATIAYVASARTTGRVADTPHRRPVDPQRAEGQRGEHQTAHEGDQRGHRVLQRGVHARPPSPQRDRRDDRHRRPPGGRAAARRPGCPPRQDAAAQEQRRREQPGHPADGVEIEQASGQGPVDSREDRSAARPGNPAGRCRGPRRPGRRPTTCRAGAATGGALVGLPRPDHASPHPARRPVARAPSVHRHRPPAAYER